MIGFIRPKHLQMMREEFEMDSVHFNLNGKKLTALSIEAFQLGSLRANCINAAEQHHGNAAANRITTQASALLSSQNNRGRRDGSDIPERQGSTEECVRAQRKQRDSGDLERD
ncbi:hypothetical protein LguiB_013299 [Lonicera macranthoides]